MSATTTTTQQNNNDKLTLSSDAMSSQDQNSYLLEASADNVNISSSVPMQQTTSFLTNSPSQDHSLKGELDVTFTGDMMKNADLAHFLERPTIIHEFSWTEGTPLGQTKIYPWQLFFQSTPISKKIDNFAFISCNLHIKVLINSTPFNYGALFMSYEPLVDYGMTLESSSVLTPTQIDIMRVSQAPHIMITPQDSCGGDMVLPFFYPTDWLDLTSLDDVTNMGVLYFTEVASLASANGTSGQTVTIQVYAWAEDVKLSGNTYKLSLQAGKKKGKQTKSGVKITHGTSDSSIKESGKDEYWDTPISSVASTVATYAAALSTVPDIGPIATATSMVATGVSNIAKLFGYTNPPVIDDVQPIRLANYHAFSSSEIGVPADKFTLDPKQELSIDPRTVGLDGTDEMAINYICGRESYLCSIPWSTSDPHATVLFYAPVGPTYYQFTTVPSHSTEYQFGMTPASLCAQNFKYWRGDIIFRFKFICSRYHNGRVRVTWDPRDVEFTSGTGNSTTCFNKIIDLSVEDEVEIRIPYNQARRFLEIRPPNPAYETFLLRGSTFSDLSDPAYWNGNLTVKVINSLSAPESTSSINILCFVRAAENFELAVPTTQLNYRYSYWAPQSGLSMKDGGVDSAEHSIAGYIPEERPEQYSVYFGENVRSIRALMRRAVAASPLMESSPSLANSISARVFSRSIFPMSNGWNLTSNLQAVSPATSTPFSYMWELMSPFQVMVPCYKGMRGGMIWHFEALNLENVSERVPIYISRLTRDPNTGSIVTNYDATSINSNIYPPLFTGNIIGSIATDMTTCEQAGSTLMITTTNEGKSVLCPNMFNYRFDTACPYLWYGAATAAFGSASRKYPRNESITVGTISTTINSPYTNKTQMIRRYYSIAPDFTTFFFLATPVLYMYSAVPVPYL